jgi:hypothetical protein
MESAGSTYVSLLNNLMYKFQITHQDFVENTWFQNWQNTKVVDTWEHVSSDIPVITASNLLRYEVRHWLKNSQPAIYIGRGYLGNHIGKGRWWWRYSVNSWANTELMPIPYSRWGLTELPRHPWKVKAIKNILLAPSKMTSKVWESSQDGNWTDQLMDQFPGATVRIRPKARKSKLRWSTLWDDLDWADLVIAQSSAITCEAFWYGKKVISLEPCPTWAAGRTLLDNWQDPTEPAGRDQWHEHLAWSQFSRTEWETGEALNLIEKYLGPVVDYRSEYAYNFI